MKRFMMFSVSALCLAVAVLIGFHVGSQKAEAQTGMAIIGFSTDLNSTLQFAMLENGDVYSRAFSAAAKEYGPAPAVFAGNFFEGSGVVATDQSTWGDIKQR